MPPPRSLVSVLLLFATAGCGRVDHSQKMHVRTILFIQGDLSAQNPCDRTKLHGLWDAEGLVSKTVDELLGHHYELHQAGGRTSVAAYAINAAVTPLGTFSDLSEDWKNPSRLGTGVGRRAAARDLVLGLGNAYRTAIGDQIDGNLKNTRQDVARAILLLLTAQKEFFEAGTERVRVVFLSDMLHYNTDGATDASRNRFSFVDSYSREVFRRSVQAGTLPPSVPLSPLPENITFEVFSIGVPRCPDEVWGDGKIHDFSVIGGEVNAIWQSVFERLGADRIELGRTSPDGMLSTHE